MRTPQRAGGQVDVVRLDGGGQLVDADLPRGQRARVRWMRTAYFCEPNTCTCATPLTVEMRCAMKVVAYSSIAESGSVGEVERQVEDGLIGRVDLLVGGRRRHLRRELPLRLGDGGLHVCAAASMLRDRSNCSVMVLTPSWLVDVIESRPAMVVNWRSSGVATALAIVSGDAPGSTALTRMVGSPRWAGRDGQQPVGLDAEEQQARHDQRGHHRRLMNGSEMFTTRSPRPRL